MRCSAAWVVAVLLGWVVPAHAEPPSVPKTVALSWLRLPGAERCADMRELANRVDAHLQRSAFVVPSLAQLQIEASVEPTPVPGWKVRIALFDQAGPAGTRELLIEQPSCADAIDAAALAIAVTIDPDVALHSASPAVASVHEASAPKPAPQVAPREQPARPGPVQACAERAPTPEIVHWRARLSLGGVLAGGGLPSVAPGVYGAIRLAPPSGRWGFELAALHLAPQTADVPQSNGRVRFDWTSAELSGWLRAWQVGAWSVTPAVGVEAASVGAVGSRLKTSRSQRSWLLNARLELELSWHFAERWSWLLRPSFGLPLRYDHFDATVDGREVEVFQPSLTGSVALGVGFEP